MSVIPDASGESLESFVVSNIEQGSVIVTDGWRGYSFLDTSDYHHTKILKKRIG